MRGEDQGEDRQSKGANGRVGGLQPGQRGEEIETWRLTGKYNMWNEDRREQVRK
jgi:hypothetical protein